ncbi:RNA-binding protein MRN1 [Astathelohania contejeani]|uniref:RNA-binding protein MRN1 n=1 Tax=Astathelohania contejeani TaxID=164912 RepID=A0ABQ7HXW0_9MICR|nr:RNA-binding protein MRN1 [Thelohania contejeani]
MFPRTLIVHSLPEISADYEIESIVKENNEIKINFFSYYTLYKYYTQLSNTKDVKLGDPMELSSNIRNAFHSGASRRVWLKDAEESEADLAREFGEVESVQWTRNTMKIVFMEIGSALKFVKHYSSDLKRIGFVRNDEERLENRTLYFGSITSDITEKDLISAIVGGDIYTCKILRDRSCGFVSFVSSESASAFLALCKAEPMRIKGNNIKVSTANGTKITIEGIIACYDGATRVLECPKEYRNEIEEYGDIEEIIEEEGKIRVSFFNLMDAYRAKKKMEGKERCDIYYGKDKCGRISSRDIMLYLQEIEYNKYIS